MAQDSKVVSLHQRDLGHTALPAPLIRLRDSSAGWLRVLLGDFFDEADDALFAMADKAGSNAEQAAYFDAMRELRLQRKSLILSLLQWVGRAFNEIGRFEPKRRASGSLESGADRDSLSLVDDSALEEQVALENMVTKIRNHYNEQILLLHVRIEHLLSAVKLPLDQNPLGPSILCQGLGEACADLEVDIRAKLVVYKLFDKFLIARLGSFYQDANSELARDGVLPELRRPPLPESRQGPRTPHNGALPTAGVNSSGDHANDGTETVNSETFAQLSELLHGSDFSRDLASNIVSEQANLSTSNLITLLSGFQGKLREPGVKLPSGTNLQKLVGRLIAHQRSGTGQVEQVDADVINLVSMLFDFILEDRQLPDTMKSLLARLQIPILKVALLDRSFFNRGGHPARKLLNELAMAAVGWTEKREGQRDPLREKIESVVERFIVDFDSDIGLVQVLLDDFSQFMDADRRRRELVEQRLRDAEEGRARSQQAKVAVAETLAASREGYQIPEAARALFEDAWSRVLHWVFLREGMDGDQWQEAIATTELLIWTIDPRPVTSGTRSALLKAIPSVVDAVRDGLQTIGWDPFAADKLIRDLEMVHVDVLQNIGLLEEKDEVPPQAPAQESHKFDSGAGPGLLDSQPPVTGLSPAVEAPQQLEGVESDGLHSAQADVPEQEAAASGLWRQRAEGLRVGSWLELQEGELKLRCKLAAVIKATGMYIFVNRSGTKVAEYPLKDVALALEEERLRMLDDGLIFDRALESVIGNLRNNRRD